MSTSRRTFVKNGTMVAVAASLPLGLAEHALAGSKDLIGSSSSASGAFSKNAFETALHTEFQVSNGIVKGGLELVAVTDLARPKNFNAKSGREGFKLTFRGKDPRPLRQDTYELKHKNLGSTRFLLTPTSNPEKGPLYYEIVVNRLYA